MGDVNTEQTTGGQEPNPLESGNTPAGTDGKGGPLTPTEKSLADRLHAESEKNKQLQELLEKLPASLDNLAGKMNQSAATPQMTDAEEIEQVIRREMQADIKFFEAEVAAGRKTEAEAEAELDRLAGPIRKNIKLEREIQGLRSDLNSVKAESKVPQVRSVFSERGIEPGSELYKNVMADLKEAGIDLEDPEVVRALPVELIQKQVNLAVKANKVITPQAPKPQSQAANSIPAHDTGYNAPEDETKATGAKSFAELRKKLGYV